MQQNQKTQPFSHFAHAQNTKKQEVKKPRKTQAHSALSQPYTREEGHGKDPFTSIQCMQTSYELNLHSPSHQSTKYPEEIS